MAKPSQQQIDWTREDHNSFLSSLLTFWTTSFNSCFTSRDPGQSCISVRLVCLSSLLLLVSCLHLVGQRCKHHGGHPGHTVTSLYCFLGNLCGFTGAILSRQLHIQVFMGLISASLDMVNVISWCIPLCFCRNLQAERRQRMIKRRRRSHLLAVCLLAVLTGGFLKSGVLHSPAADRVFRGRRLLYVALQNNTEILGYTLGLVSFAITSTSKFPTLYRVHRGKTLSRSHIFSGVLCLLAAALYAAAILHYDTRVSFLLRVMPWLLSAISGASLDLLTIVLHWCHLGTRQQPMSFSAEMEGLLSDSYQDKAAGKHHGKQGKNFNSTEMGRYMDVSIDTTKQMYPREATVCGKVVDTKVLSRTGPMWDFEEGNAQWSEPNAKPQNGEAFPLQEWPSNPKPFNIRTYASCILPQNGVSCHESVSQSK
ncbi:transmembrane protein 44 isoform X2 [Hippocampus comes]|uniref:Transmembrane protein 44 n=1 Tax=Hippocampus comes TaxID=109280 RepID=A0A3Q2Y936_HIPCM|nr:PREDICTED: transmembrane protein 44 isoform X2 [Hippocampus comes]